MLSLQKTMLERQLDEVKKEYKKLLNHPFNSEMIDDAKSGLRSYAHMIPTNAWPAKALTANIKNAIHFMDK
jgi:hypothetical protein